MPHASEYSPLLGCIKTKNCTYNNLTTNNCEQQNSVSAARNPRGKYICGYRIEKIQG